MTRAAPFLLALLAVVGCADLVGAHFDDPKLLTSGLACTVTGAQPAAVRPGNFAPSGSDVDFCFTRTDGTSPIDGTPVAASSGVPAGLGYAQLLAPIPVPAGAYSVSVQPAGQGCSATPLATTSICVDRSVTILLLGDRTASFEIAALPESTSPASGVGLRFVDAVTHQTGGLDFGQASAPQLPASVSPIFSDVPFGAAATAGTSPGATIDANGYAVVPSSTSATTSLAVAPAGTTGATQVVNEVLSDGHRYTAFASGSAIDPAFPPDVYVCDETLTDGSLTPCGGEPLDLQVTAYDAFLFGPFALHPTARKQPMFDAIAQLPSDLVCVTNVLSDDDKATLVTTAFQAGHLIYPKWFADTPDTPVDDPTDQNGNVPPPRTVPACTSTTDQTNLAAALSCLSANCASTDGSGTIEEDPTECIAEHCTVPLETIITVSPDCWGCALGELQSEATFTLTSTECTTDPKAGLVGNGASGIVMLSRHPILDTWQYVLPSTGTRSGLVGATVSLQNGATLDVICGQTTSPGDGAILPYTGQYGDGLGTGAQAWQAELLLQTDKVVAFTKKRLAQLGRRTILAGQWNTGPEVSGVLASNNPDAFAALSAALAQAAPVGYAPACTYCSANPLVTPPGSAATAQDVWGDYALLGRIPVTDVASAQIVLDQNAIPYMGYEIPPSLLYGYSATVRVRP
jgi:hypothetical protein